MFKRFIVLCGLLGGLVSAASYAGDVRVVGPVYIKPVTGSTTTVTVSNFPATQTVSGSVAVSNFPSTQTVSGSVAVSNFPATQPVSGTFWQTTQPVSGPLTNSELRATGIPVIAALGDSANLDAFSRLRVSNPEILFEATNQSGAISDTLESSTTRGGSALLISTASRVELRTSVTSGSRALLQSHGYINYQPGKSQLVLLTAVFGPSTSNNSQQLGLFDNNNGIYFRVNGSGVAVCERSDVGGAIVDTCVNQSAWNIDPVDGSGRSGQTVVFQKTQIYVIDFQWLGVGRIRYGLDLNGVITYVHETHHNNIFSDVYMRTPNLPIRFENVNTAVATPNTLNAICAAVISEGGSSETAGVYFSSSSVNTPRTVTATGGTVFAIRVTPGVRTTVLPLDADIYSDGAIYYSVRYNPVVTAGTWVTVPGSAIDVLSSTGTVSGGRTIFGGYIGAASGTSKTVGSQAFRPSRARFATNIFGTSSDILAIVAYSVPSGNVGVAVSMDWAERR